jgi:hypothetical protein
VVIYYLLTFLFVLQISIASLSADQQDLAGRIVLPKINDQEIENILNNLRKPLTSSNYSQLPDNQKLTLSGELDHQKFWSGNIPDLTTRLGALELQFTNSNSSRSSFWMYVNFSEERVLKLKTSRSGIFGPAVGLEIKTGEKRIVPISVTNFAPSRIAVAVSEDSQPRNYKVLICLREIAKDKHGLGELKESGYQIVDIKTDVAASLSGKITGHGKITGEILVTTPFPVATEYFDAASGNDQSISLEYRPTKVASQPDIFTVFKFNESETFGIVARLIQVNSGSYKRISQSEDTISITNLSFPPYQDIQFTEHFTQGSGNCFLLRRNAKFLRIFSRD